MELRIAVKDKKLDHLCLFNVDGKQINQAQSISGHRWVRLTEERGYNRYPLSSFWALVATFPAMDMAPNALLLWNKLNGRDERADIFTERAIDIPRFRHDRLPPNRHGKRVLRPAQVAAIEISLKEKRFLNALDTRVGKNAVYMAVHLKIQELKGYRSKSLMVCPPNVKWEIWRQFSEIIEDLGIQVVEGHKENRRYQIERFLGEEDQEVLVIGYPSLVSHVDEYGERLSKECAARFADESHYMLYPWTKRTQATKSIRPEYIILGTGTPAKIGIHQLHEQINDVDPTFFPDEFNSDGSLYKWGYERMEETLCIRVRVKKGRGSFYRIVGYHEEAVKPVFDHIHKKMLRVRFKEVAEQMPQVAEPPVLVPLADDHMKFYREVKKQLKKGIDPTGNKHRLTPMTAALRLHQAAVHPALVDPSCSIIGTKPDEAVNLAVIMDEPFVLMTKHPAVVDVLCGMLEESDLTYTYTKADLSMMDRFTRARIFQAGEVQVFVTTIGISKEGIQLDRANSGAFVDGSHSPMDMLQAARRLMNPDKSDPITWYHLLGKDTIDPRVFEIRAERHADLAFWIDRELDPSKLRDLESAIALDAVRAELEGEPGSEAE